MVRPYKPRTADKDITGLAKCIYDESYYRIIIISRFSSRMTTRLYIINMLSLLFSKYLFKV